MYILSSFCDMHWLLSWILPFLLGLLLGWWLWYRYKRMVADLENKISGHKRTIADLEAKLAACKSARADLEGDLALAKGRTREMESERDRYKKALDAKGSAPAAPAVPAAAVSSLAATPKAAPTPAAAPSKPKGYAGLKDDNLQIIEGIGPKMESVLKENGVHTWSALGAKSTADLQGILGNYGDRYKIINPESWSRQAQLAASGEWMALSALQKELDGGVATGSGTTSNAKVDKMLIKMGLIRKYVENDLKVVEGIGPKIEQLLNKAGITTWRRLATSSKETIQQILSDAGSRYKLADPSTWPKQAQLAADGEWDKLEEYQDYLQGGKG